MVSPPAPRHFGMEPTAFCIANPSPTTRLSPDSSVAVSIEYKLERSHGALFQQRKNFRSVFERISHPSGASGASGGQSRLVRRNHGKTLFVTKSNSSFTQGILNKFLQPELTGSDLGLPTGILIQERVTVVF